VLHAEGGAIGLAHAIDLVEEQARRDNLRANLGRRTGFPFTATITSPKAPLFVSTPRTPARAADEPGNVRRTGTPSTTPSLMAAASLAATIRSQVSVHGRRERAGG